MFGSFTKCNLYLLVKLILHFVYIQAESREGDKSVFFSRRALKLTGGKDNEKIQKVEENGKKGCLNVWKRYDEPFITVWFSGSEMNLIKEESSFPERQFGHRLGEVT